MAIYDQSGYGDSLLVMTFFDPLAARCITC
jgi:hypothetical protein